MKDYLKKKSIMGAICKHIFDLLTFLLHCSTIFKINWGVLFPMSRQAKRILICLISLPKLHEQNRSSCYRTRLDSLFFGQVWFCLVRVFFILVDFFIWVLQFLVVFSHQKMNGNKLVIKQTSHHHLTVKMDGKDENIGWKKKSGDADLLPKSLRTKTINVKKFGN